MSLRNLLTTVATASALALVMPWLVIVFSAVLLWFSWFARSQSWFGQVSPTVERE